MKFFNKVDIILETNEYGDLSFSIYIPERFLFSIDSWSKNFTTDGSFLIELYIKIFGKEIVLSKY